MPDFSANANLRTWWLVGNPQSLTYIVDKKNQGKMIFFQKKPLNLTFKKNRPALVTDLKLGNGVQNGGVRAAPLRSARVCVANIKHKGASDFAVRPLAKSRAGSEILRGGSTRLRSARESSTKSRESSRLFGVRWYVNSHREAKQSEVTKGSGEASRSTTDSVQSE
jgi:hypothetical protein